MGERPIPIDDIDKAKKTVQCLEALLKARQYMSPATRELLLSAFEIAHIEKKLASQKRLGFPSLDMMRAIVARCRKVDRLLHADKIYMEGLTKLNELHAEMFVRRFQGYQTPQTLQHMQKWRTSLTHTRSCKGIDVTELTTEESGAYELFVNSSWPMIHLMMTGEETEAIPISSSDDDIARPLTDLLKCLVKMNLDHSFEDVRRKIQSACISPMGNSADAAYLALTGKFNELAGRLCDDLEELNKAAYCCRPFVNDTRGVIKKVIGMYFRKFDWDTENNKLNYWEARSHCEILRMLVARGIVR